MEAVLTNQPEQETPMTTVEDNELTTEEWLTIREEAGLRIKFANTPHGAAVVARADGKATLAAVGA
jgi:hypothetical protein